MKLSVAANYDVQLTARLRQYPVQEVYGKLPADIVGGGRPSYMASPLTMRGLTRYVESLRRCGIEFNYLLNTACMGNREWGRPFQKKLMHLLDSLAAAGIGRLTVSTPLLLEIIKKRFPQFYLKVGIYAQVDTPRRARFWRDLGADALTLESFSINRNFDRLAAIRQAVDCELVLIANHPCLPNCPMQTYHQAGIAHGSNGSRRLFLDYCFMRCTRLRLQDPSMLIKSQWIRPEDLEHYEKLGYSSFKLLERGIPSAELLKRVEAYSRRRFEGNLAELLLPYGFAKASRKQRFWTLRHFIRPGQMSPLKAIKLLQLARSQGMLHPMQSAPIHIDSSALPADFLEGFRSRDCLSLDCSKCGYCEEIAAAAVRIDDQFRNQSLNRFAELEAMVATGGLWSV